MFKIFKNKLATLTSKKWYKNYKKSICSKKSIIFNEIY